MKINAGALAATRTADARALMLGHRHRQPRQLLDLMTHRPTLFVLTLEPGRLPIQAHPHDHLGGLETFRVDVPGAGRP